MEAACAASVWVLEATLGIEPRIGVLQTPALPLGYVAEKRSALIKGYPEHRAAANTRRPGFERAR